MDPKTSKLLTQRLRQAVQISRTKTKHKHSLRFIFVHKSGL